MSAFCEITIEKDDKYVDFELFTSYARFLGNVFTYKHNYLDDSEIETDITTSVEDIKADIEDKNSAYNEMKNELIKIVGVDNLARYVPDDTSINDNTSTYAPDTNFKDIYDGKRNDYCSVERNVEQALTAYILADLVTRGYDVTIGYDF